MLMSVTGTPILRKALEAERITGALSEARRSNFAAAATSVALPPKHAPKESAHQ